MQGDIGDEEGEAAASGEATVFDPEAGNLDDLRRKYGLLPLAEHGPGPEPEPKAKAGEVMELEDDDLEVIDD